MNEAKRKFRHVVRIPIIKQDHSFFHCSKRRTSGGSGRGDEVKSWEAMDEKKNHLSRLYLVVLDKTKGGLCLGRIGHGGLERVTVHGPNRSCIGQ